MCACATQESPFSNGSSYMGILGIISSMKRQGLPVAGLVEACKQLADAQSRRSAVAAQILPSVHWVSQLCNRGPCRTGTWYLPTTSLWGP